MRLQVYNKLKKNSIADDAYESGKIDGAIDTQIRNYLDIVFNFAETKQFNHQQIAQLTKYDINLVNFIMHHQLHKFIMIILFIVNKITKMIQMMFYCLKKYPYNLK